MLRPSQMNTRSGVVRQAVVRLCLRVPVLERSSGRCRETDCGFETGEAMVESLLEPQLQRSAACRNVPLLVWRRRE